MKQLVLSEKGHWYHQNDYPIDGSQSHEAQTDEADRPREDQNGSQPGCDNPENAIVSHHAESRHQHCLSGS